jgi:hypothetical protein
MTRVNFAGGDAALGAAEIAVEATSVAGGLHRLAEQRSADLIAVGSHHQMRCGSSTGRTGPRLTARPYGEGRTGEPNARRTSRRHRRRRRERRPPRPRGTCAIRARRRHPCSGLAPSRAASPRGAARHGPRPRAWCTLSADCDGPPDGGRSTGAPADRCRFPSFSGGSASVVEASRSKGRPPAAIPARYLSSTRSQTCAESLPRWSSPTARRALAPSLTRSLVHGSRPTSSKSFTPQMRRSCASRQVPMFSTCRSPMARTLGASVTARAHSGKRRAQW